MNRMIIEWLRPFLQGSRLEPEQVLWGLLICTFVLSTLHLVTLFATRWGDRRITGKALAFSVLLHGAIAISIITVAPAPGIPQGGGEDDEEHRVTIRGVTSDVETAETNGQNSANKGGIGQTPVWDQLPPDKGVKPVAPTPHTPAVMPPPSIARAQQTLPPLKATTPDLPSTPDLSSVLPDALHEERAAPKQAAKTPEIEVPKSAPVKSSTSLASQAIAAAGPTASLPSAVPEASVSRQPTASPLPPSTQSASDHGLAAPDPSPPEPAAIPHASPIASTPASADKSQLTSKLSRAPVSDVPEALPAPSKKVAQKGRTLRGPTVSRLDGGEWHASIDRMRTNRLESSGAPVASPQPASTEGTGGGYQPIDTRTQPPVPQIHGGNGEPLLVRRSVGVPPTYRLRKLSSRRKNAQAFGGSDASERAVEASLRWLAQVQQREGNWNAKAFGAGQVRFDENGVDRNYAGRDADNGVTALAVLAFLGAGYTHEEGQYADNVERALKWLVGQQQPDGNLGFGSGHFAMMYCHGMATYALAEAYGMQNDPTANTMLREPLVRAVRYILENQNPDGGWRYLKGQKSDMSMFGWQLMGLKSAEIAGVAIPREAKVRMIGFLQERSLGDNKGLAGYREDLPPSPSMTAEALFCKQMLGIKRDNAASQEAADYLLARLPRRSAFNEYYWYYGTLAMYQFGGTGWRNWNRALRELLVSEQQTSGPFAGSWDPVGPWARYGGRIYSTALSTLCLEVYYRFLPLYQMGAPIRE